MKLDPKAAAGVLNPIELVLVLSMSDALRNQIAYQISFALSTRERDMGSMSVVGSAILFSDGTVAEVERSGVTVSRNAVSSVLPLNAHTDRAVAQAVRAARAA